MSRQKNILAVILLAGITVFSAYKYFSTLKEKDNLLADLDKADAKAMDLENEKKGLILNLDQEKQLKEELTRENTLLQKELNINTGHLAKAEKELAQAEDDFLELNSQIFIISAEAEALRQENTRLKNDLVMLAIQNQEYSDRLSSPSWLKKAIRDLKKNMRRRKIKTPGREEFDSETRSYIIGEKKPTDPDHIKIEVYSPPAD